MTEPESHAQVEPSGQVWYRCDPRYAKNAWTSQVEYAMLPLQRAGTARRVNYEEPKMATDTVSWKTPTGVEVHGLGCLHAEDGVPGVAAADLDTFAFESVRAIAHSWYAEEIGGGEMTTDEATRLVNMHPCATAAVVPHAPEFRGERFEVRKPARPIKGTTDAADAPARAPRTPATPAAPRAAVGDVTAPACGCGEADPRKYPTVKGGARDLRKCRACRKAGA